MKTSYRLGSLVAFIFCWMLWACGTALAGAFDWNYDGSGNRMRWTNGVVPYAFDQTNDPTHQPPSAEQQRMWEKCIRGWQKAANINFVKRTTEADYINLSWTKLGGESWGVNFSWVAKSGGAQPLWIYSWDDHVIFHEAGHALGFTHEHQRNDRDSYVDCWWWNIYAPPGPQYNYLKVNSDNRTAYDYYSVMHYDKDDFAATWPTQLLVLHPKDEKYLDIIGAYNWFGEDGVIPEDGIPDVIYQDGRNTAEYKKVGTYGYLSPLDRVAVKSEYGSPGKVQGTVTGVGNVLIPDVSLSIKGNGNTKDTTARMVLTKETPVKTPSTGTFTFGGLPAGSYTIKPVLANYKFTPASRTVTIAAGGTIQADFQGVIDESAPPTVNILNIGDSTPAFKTIDLVNGNATDGVGGSGVREVRVGFSDYTGKFYNFVTKAFDSADFTNNTFRLATGTVSWSLTPPLFPTLTDGWYQVHVGAIDNAGNESDYTTHAFYVDNTAPTIAWSPLKNSDFVNDLHEVGGTVTENLTPVNVIFKIVEYDPSKALSWNGSSWVTGSVELAAKVTGDQWSPVANLPTRSQMKQKDYILHARATDAAGNVYVSNITVTRTPTDPTVPELSITTPTANQVLSTNYIPEISGLASDPNTGLSEVTIYLERLKADGSGFLTWNGSTWVDDQVALGTNMDEAAGKWSAPATSSFFPSYPLPTGSNLPNGRYQIQAYAKNNESPAGTRGVAQNFSVDYHASYIWTGATMRDSNPNNDSNVWQVAENWSPNGVPGASDVATIANGDNVVTVSPVTLYGYNFTKGKVDFQNANHTITVTKVMNWDGGLLTNKLNIAAGAVLNLVGETDKGMADSTVLNNFGTINWLNGRVATNGYTVPPVINNQPGGVLNLTKDGSPFATDHGSIFNNASNAKIIKTGGTGTTLFERWGLNTKGELRANTGTLEYTSALNLMDGGKVFGPGKHLRSSGALSMVGTTTAENTTFTLGGGTMAGSSTALFASGTNGIWNWTGGTMSSTFANTGTFTFAGGQKNFTDSAVFNNGGTVDWTEGIIYCNGYTIPATINNKKTFTVKSIDLLATDHGGRFNNLAGATFSRYGTGSTVSKWEFNNAGLTRSIAGTLSLESGGTSTGNFQTTAGQFINFNGGTHRLTNAIFSGQGRSQILKGNINVSGYINLGDAASPSTLDFIDGTLDGSATYRSGNAAKSTLNWTGGTIGGTQNWSATMQVNIGDSVGGTIGKNLANSTVINNLGLVNFTGTLPVQSDGYTGGATINNGNGAVFTIANVSTPFATSHGSTFDNRTGAKLVKTGTGVTTLKQWGFTNTGEISAAAGTLDVNTTIHLNTGSKLVGPGLIKFTGTTNLNTPLTATHRIMLESGQLNGAASSNFSGPDFSWTGGAITGTFNLLSTSVMNISGAGTKSFADYAVLNSKGLITWSGPGSVYCNGYTRGATINNLSGANFKMLTDGIPFITDHGAIFNNMAGAQVWKSAGAGTTTFSKWSFANGTWDGTTAVAGGIIRCDTGVLDFSTALQYNGGVYQGNGQHIWSGGGVLRGLLTVADSKLAWRAGNLDAPGSSNPSSTIKTSASGNFSWMGGNLSGVLNVSPNTTFNISGAGDKSMSDYAVLNNRGIMSWNGGKIYSNGYTRGATINNLSDGQFIARSTGQLASDHGSDFVNDGIVDIGTVPMASFWHFYQSNTGRLNVHIASATTYGQLLTGRNLGLGGTITTVLTNAYLPPANTPFKVIRNKTRTGTFSTVATQGTTDRFFTAAYNTDDVTLITGQPSLSVNDVRVSEDSVAGLKANFTVSLSAARSAAITVNYATANGTATAGSDYTATSGTLTFAAGEKSKTVSVPILSDLLNEGEETFLLKLSNASGAAISDGEGTGFIVDNDAPPTMSINDILVNEGNGGVQTNATFTVTLSTKSARTVTVKYATSNGNALAGSDYTAATATLTFAPGETSKTLTVMVNGDSIDENDEAFAVLLSNNVNAGIAKVKGTGTIKDDDSSAISVNSPQITESAATATLNFTVKLSLPSDRTVSVYYKTGDAPANSATANTDYVSLPVTQLVFAPGETTKTIAVTIKGDALDEVDEQFILVLANPSNATIVATPGVGTILDDDPSPSLSINDISLKEGNSSTTPFTFTVKLSAASGRKVTVNFATFDGTTTAGTDYVAQSGTLTFNPGETSKTVTVAVKGDTAFEAAEKLGVQLSTPSGATIADNAGVGTILNDDPSAVGA